MNWQLTGIIIGWIAFCLSGLRWKCRIQFRMLMMPVLLSGMAAYIVTWTIQIHERSAHIMTSVLLPAIVIGIGLAGYLMYRFFRDPERHIADQSKSMVSPADGIVRYVKIIGPEESLTCIKKGQPLPLDEDIRNRFFNEKSWLIGIEMSLLDVHVNRMPIEGDIVFQKHVQGEFLSLRNPEAMCRNEHVSTVISNGRMNVGIIQIASRLVRRIIIFRTLRDHVHAGERFGKIVFGSQVDLVFPCAETKSVLVKTGDHILAGISMIADITNDAPNSI